MADVKWIKITTDIFDDEKILLIEGLPSSDEIIVIWFKLLILAGKQNNNGVFLMNERIPYTDEMLATIFRRDINIVRLALKTFEQFGMLELVDNVITIPNWNKHQQLDSYEKKKQQDRERQKARRAEQKVLALGTKDVNKNSEGEKKSRDSRWTIAGQSRDSRENVAENRGLDKEEDIDIDIEKNIKKEKPNKSALDDLIFKYTSNPDLNKAIKDFVDMRKRIKKPLTERALNILFVKLDTLSGGNDSNKIKILENSILNCWQGIFELKPEQKEKTQEEILREMMRR
ncbi:phage replisome organizer N-terminal domain-containing protein [Phascolarctobacterium faecium]|uniref:phage replisome organizer N-terminal domain-containing protein n=1 Tax=Phascolarctobacterium faecium TaxID=33025 RepID=UPI003AEF32DF